MSTLATAASFVLVGACWGCTNPLLKEGTSDAKCLGEPQQGGPPGSPPPGGTHHRASEAQGRGRSPQHSATGSSGGASLRLLARVFAPLASMAKMKALIPYLVNQSGSVLYYYLLGSQELSMAVPLCNSLTFVFTTATAWWLGEELARPRLALLGMAAVLLGIAICVTSTSTATGSAPEV